MSLMLKWSIGIMRVIVFTAGLLFIAFIVLGFTHYPFRVYHWLGTSEGDKNVNPEYIVVLGGGGMPSKFALIRTYFSGRLWMKYREADIIVALPGDIRDSASSLMLMKKELIVRGVDPARITIENKGTNTRSQALFIYDRLSEQNRVPPIALVTAPEHMRRAVLTFRKAGFEKIAICPAFESALEADLFFKDDELGGKRDFVPGIGSSIGIRYRFWIHLKYEVMILRECAALLFYDLKGWI